MAARENSKTDDLYKKMIRDKTGQERLLMGFEMLDLSAKLVLSSLENRVTGMNLKKEVFLRFYRTDFNEEEREKILTALK